MFLQFSPILQPPCFHWSLASAVVRMSCSLWVHAGGCEREARGFFAWLPGSCRCTHTHCAPPKRALLLTKGFCGASKKRQQATHEPSKTNENLKDVVNTACRPRVFQIAHFKGFPNIPHIPTPIGHSRGAIEATTAALSKNAQSWQKQRRHREIYKWVCNGGFTIFPLNSAKALHCNLLLQRQKTNRTVFFAR